MISIETIDLNLVLDLHSYDGLDIIPQQFDMPVMTHLDSNVGTVTLRYDNHTNFNKVELFLQKLLWEDGEFQNSSGHNMEIMRLKANVTLDDGNRRVLIQGVHDTYDTYDVPQNDIKSLETEENSNNCPYKDSNCIFVLIGKYLDYQILQKALSACLN